MRESLRQYKAGIFQALAHPTRVAIVELLDQQELSVGQLCEQLSIEQANASQHLAVLRNKSIVQTRKAGNQTYYRLQGPVFGQVLESLREYFVAHMTEALASIKEEQAEAEKTAARGGKPKTVGRT